ncbi:MAG: hypothetical protein GOP50_07380 [Candidatus Heimdallarchaeota archaeon]|nr:hypothetical protein [Candidatus Heimdallarchaeota archaeon]
MSSPTYSGLISSEEALEREKSAFILDKAILRAICEEGPLSLEDIRVQTLPLEAAIGVKIDLPTIQEIINKYIKQGLIWENK